MPARRDNTEHDLRQLAAFIDEAGEQGVTRTAISCVLFQQNRTAAQLDNLITTLLDDGPYEKLRRPINPNGRSIIHYVRTRDEDTQAPADAHYTRLINDAHDHDLHYNAALWTSNDDAVLRVAGNADLLLDMLRDFQRRGLVAAIHYRHDRADDTA